MKRFFIVFLVVGVYSCSGHADSFLTAQQFPKTFEDLSFTDKLEVIKDGYEPYAAEYDENGFCIKNCAYYGLNIKQEEYIIEQDTMEALEQSEQYQEQMSTDQNNANSTVSYDSATETIINSVSVGNMCQNRNPNISTGQKVPWGEPLLGHQYITSPFGPRGSGFHDGIDYAASIGTPIYAPADGRVISAGQSGRCGNMVILQHDDGIKTIYCHLSKIYVKSGQNVSAGCSFAETGNTGHSTGPHLHYAMQKNGKKINPSAYTKRNNG